MTTATTPRLRRDDNDQDRELDRLAAMMRRRGRQRPLPPVPPLHIMAQQRRTATDLEDGAMTGTSHRSTAEPGVVVYTPGEIPQQPDAAPHTIRSRARARGRL